MGEKSGGDHDRLADGQDHGTVEGIGGCQTMLEKEVQGGQRTWDNCFCAETIPRQAGDGIACRSGRTESSEGWMERLEF